MPERASLPPIKARQMVFVHSWSVVRELYIYRDDLGILEPLRASFPNKR
jgi:hypothetical protein